MTGVARPIRRPGARGSGTLLISQEVADRPRPAKGAIIGPSHNLLSEVGHGHCTVSGARPAGAGGMTPISVALVEDDARTRERFAHVIRSEPSLRFAFSASTAGVLLDWFADNPVDVLLVDLGLPDLSGLEVIRRCARTQPECSVMVITMFGDEANMLRAFEAGARGYLLKDGTESDLATHVRSLHAGGSPMSPIIARRLLSRWNEGVVSNGATTSTFMATTLIAPSTVAAGGVDPLSRREAQVLDLIARGFSYAEIAHQLAVSVTTVQTHVRNVYGKLGVHNRSEAVFEARQYGLLP
jgi:DNA-binding NarL/FixJ family response regulator